MHLPSEFAIRVFNAGCNCNTLGHTEELPGVHELTINPWSFTGITEIQAHQRNVATCCRLKTLTKQHTLSTLTFPLTLTETVRFSYDEHNTHTDNILHTHTANIFARYEW